MLKTLSSPPFYTTYVSFPTGQTIPQKIQQNHKFWPYFKDALGALDGSHIAMAPPSHIRGNYHNRKGFLSQNCLFACNFDFFFIYSLTGWEGSATDARIWNDAQLTDLRIPDGKYLLADAGFPLCEKLLVPFQGVHYHLAEWGHANTRQILSIIKWLILMIL